MVIFSAYWPVLNNPKETHRMGHIAHLRKTEVDLFFGPKSYGLDCLEVVLDRLPVESFGAKLFALSDCVLKFGLPVQVDAFQSLVKIWLSKPLFFPFAKEILGNGENYVWVDCVHRPNIGSVLAEDSGKICINRYGGRGTIPMHPQPFRGTCGTPHLATIDPFISGSVIKVPEPLIDDFVVRYREMLGWVDSEYRIYDEEIVLSCMYQKWPAMFTIVN